jgi:hypothetical protein
VPTAGGRPDYSWLIAGRFKRKQTRLVLFHPFVIGLPEKPHPMHRVQIFHPGDYDRKQIERARDLIKFAKQVLAESDPSILSHWHMPEPPSESRLDSLE